MTHDDFSECTPRCAAYQRDMEQLDVLGREYEQAPTVAERAVIQAVMNAIEGEPSCSCEREAEDFRELLVEEGIERLMEARHDH